MRRGRSQTLTHAVAADERDKAVLDREGAAVHDRLDRLEKLLRDALMVIDINGKRLTAVQAQLDHLSAKIRAI